MNIDPTRALEQEIRRLPRIGKAGYMMTVRNLLGKGADPNSEALLGKKSIMVMALDVEFPMSSEQRINIIPLLIAHGGNPLLHTPLLLGLIDGRDYLAKPILKAMADKHKVCWPCKSIDGGNIIHALLRQSIFIRDVRWTMHNHDDYATLKTWVKETDDAGKTPLHLMWEHLDSTWLPDAWDLTSTMSRRGVDLDEGGTGGTSVNQAIYKRLESVDLELVREEYPELCAELGGWILDRGTQSAPARSVPGARF